MDRAILVLTLAALTACEHEPSSSVPLSAPTVTPTSVLSGAAEATPEQDARPVTVAPVDTEPASPGSGADSGAETGGDDPSATPQSANADAAAAQVLAADAAVTSAPALDAGASLPTRPGDPVRGRQLLLDNGTADSPIMSCGVPQELIKLARLDRDWQTAPKIADRRDAELPYALNYVTRPNGVRLLATNCLICHATTLAGRVVIGLPDVARDFTQPDPLSGVRGASLRLLARTTLSRDAYAELTRVLRVVDVIGAFPRPDTVGINAADGMFAALTMHRAPDTLQWRDRADPAAGPVPSRMIYSDVPAWWNTHRRARLFHTGFGHGDRARILMTGALLCLEDRAEAERIDRYFPDVYAFIHALRAPRYEEFSKLPVARERAERGRAVYAERCRSCHGGKDGEGPEPLAMVPLELVGTDPVYAQVTRAESDLPEASTIDYFFGFFNRSWYGSSGPRAFLERPAQSGYAPPPLDGVWATAPYFHNGSVPTLDGVLDPALRPTRFKRSFDTADYDFERLGWPYTEVARKGDDPQVYDTTQHGYSNAGHTFAADLAPEARRDLFEYLKTF